MALTLDDTDLLILTSLRDNARLSLRDLAKITSLSAPAVSARIKRLEEAKVIIGYNALISKDKFGLSLEAKILVNISPAYKGEFIDFLLSYLCVSELLELTGEYNFEILAAFSDIKALHEFIELLELKYGKCYCALVLDHSIPRRSALTRSHELKTKE